MPLMSGMELSRALLKLRPDLPIIMQTGFSETVTEESAREEGIRCLLRKPVIPADLYRKISEILMPEHQAR